MMMNGDCDLVELFRMSEQDEVSFYHDPSIFTIVFDNSGLSNVDGLEYNIPLLET